MFLKKWESLPDCMKTDKILPYYESLKRKRTSLFFKRFFDIFASFVMLIVLSPVFLILALAIKLDSKGPVFYRQTRITQYGKKFRIFKFRTMVHNADTLGAQVTVGDDARVTKVGKVIRKLRLDEISQLIDVFRGTMTFVGTRPEVTKYVDYYSEEMLATLLLPAGVTSKASIFFKDEAELLEGEEDPDEAYVKEILPCKMKYNLKDIEEFGFFNDIKIMFMTVFAVLGKKYGDELAEIPPKEAVLSRK